MVEMNEKQQPRAPRIPSLLFQNPTNKSVANSHSATPRNQVAPRTPKTWYIQESGGPWPMYGGKACVS